ncbi:protein kinase [Streptomyces sp. NPDC057702]|uniref:serine/threonine-protein kinase n=1 Tax=unclassified Streptomyces TaxID=2593676 RepID=UPI00368EC0F0
MERLERGDPRRFGAYAVLARIGSGGTATVYLGRSPGGRAVAVKALHAELAREPEHRARFQREVALTREVGGAHSPALLGADPKAPVPWMATEYLPSLSLRDAVERFGPLPPAVLRQLAARLAESLAALHRARVIHLDVKPANVLLTADGPRLIDFGIAARTRRTGVAGSPGFMSPEQVAGTAGPPSDVYSLGLTLAHAAGHGAARDEPHGGDPELGQLLSACRAELAAARPTAAELADRLAALTPPPARWDVGWLPQPIMRAIDAEASTAANPPVPARRRPPRRLLLGAGALTLTGGVALTLGLPGRGPAPGPGPTASLAGPGPGAPPTATPAGPSPRPRPEPVVVRFVITGDGPLISLSYAVNGRFTTLRDVPLSWQRSVEVPREGGRVDWRLRLTAPTPAVRCRVLVDGAEKWDGPHPHRPLIGPAPYPVDVSGSVAFRDPSPTPVPRVGAFEQEGLAP